MSFDAYREWLQIPADRRPVNHYDLLGLEAFEPDSAKIRAAGLSRIANVRRYQVGPQSETAIRVMGELAAAFSCLTDAPRKAEYDAQLRGRQTVMAAENETRIEAETPSASQPFDPPPMVAGIGSTIAAAAHTDEPPPQIFPAQRPIANPAHRLEWIPVRPPEQGDVHPAPVKRALGQRSRSTVAFFAIAGFAAALLIGVASLVPGDADRDAEKLARQEEKPAERAASPVLPAEKDLPPSQNQPPVVTSIQAEPKAPRVGAACWLEFEGKDPEGSPLSFKYRRPPSSAWIDARGKRALLTDLTEGILKVEVACVDEKGLSSEIRSHSLAVASASPAPPVQSGSPGQTPGRRSTGGKPNVPVGLAPRIVVVSATPNAPQAGGSLEIELEVVSEDAQARAEYRRAGQAWQSIQDRRLSLANLEAGPLMLSFRAVDRWDRSSATATRSWSIQPAPQQSRATAWRELRTLSTRGLGVRSLSFSPDGALLACGGDNGKVVVFRVADGRRQTAFACAQRGFVSLAFGPNNDDIAAACFNVAGIWSARNGKLVAALIPGVGGAVSQVAFLPSGIVLVGVKDAVWFFNRATGARSNVRLNGDVLGVCAAPSRGGTFAVEEDGTIHYFSELEPLPTSRNVWAGTLNRNPLGLVCSADGRLVGIDATKKVWVWDGDPSSRRDKVALPINLPGVTLTGLAFNSDGGLLASGASDGAVRLWRMPVGELTETLVVEKPSACFSVAFSPDGDLLAVGGAQQVILWSRQPASEAPP